MARSSRVMGGSDALHLAHLIGAEAFLGQSVEELRPRVGIAPQRPQFVLVPEELRESAEEHLQELLGRHRRAVRVPEARHHHVLDGSRFSVGEFHLELLTGRRGFRLEPARPIKLSQVIDSTIRQKRQNRYFSQTEVHSGYTAY